MANGKWRMANGNPDATRGIVAFSTILILSAIVVEVGVAASVLVYFLNRSNYGVRLTNEAFAAARAGIDDAVVRVLRTRFYPTCEAAYTIPVGASVQADVTITNVDCSAVSETQYTVFSIGRVTGKRRTLQATLGLHPTTREVRVLTVTEI